MVGRRRIGALAIWTLAATSPAAAQVVADAPSAASVTIYRDSDVETGQGELDPSQGLAMITETRTVEVPAGKSRIAFRDVADTLVSETVALDGLPGRAVERNEDFDLLSPGALLDRSVGRTVRVVQTDRAKGAVSERQAVLRSGSKGVLLDFGGQVEALGCDGVPTRLVFEAVPAGLGDKPTFSVLADVPKAGRYTVKLSYLATGFSWSADYVARIRPDGRTLDLEGWLTLSNKSSASFAKVPTQVVAGQLERDASTVPPRPEPTRMARDCWGPRPPPPPPPVGQTAYRIAPSAEIEEIVVTGSKRKAVVSNLGDYKLYTLPEPTTVAARQTKQVAFLDQPAVPFQRAYVYRLNAYEARDPEAMSEAPDVVLRLQNKPQFGLGKPLPAGTVSVMEPGGGGLVLAGQQSVRDTAVGLPLELAIGRAMDVAVTPVVVRDAAHDGLETRQVSVAIANGKPVPILFEFHQPRIGEDFEVSQPSQRPTFKAGDEVWTFRLQPGQRAQLSYTISYR